MMMKMAMQKVCVAIIDALGDAFNWPLLLYYCYSTQYHRHRHHCHPFRHLRQHSALLVLRLHYSNAFFFPLDSKIEIVR